VIEPSTLATVLKRAAVGRCPNCGKGALFRRYLKQVESCVVCGERFGGIRADDGPAWLTILVVGHILGFVLLVVLPRTTWPEWVSMIVWPAAALGLALLLLPRAKGLFIAMIWRTNCTGAGK
jgi:uncharacterized protein (DUF983 family)